MTQNAQCIEVIEVRMQLECSIHFWCGVWSLSENDSDSRCMLVCLGGVILWPVFGSNSDSVNEYLVDNVGYRAAIWRVYV